MSARDLLEDLVRDARAGNSTLTVEDFLQALMRQGGGAMDIDPGRGTDSSAFQMRASAAYKQIRDKVQMVANNPGSFGVLSTAEKIAVALVLERSDVPDRDSERVKFLQLWGGILECCNRLGFEWLRAAILVQRDGGWE